MLGTHSKRKRRPVVCSSCGDTLLTTSRCTRILDTTTSDTSRSRTAATATTPNHATVCSLCSTDYTQSTTAATIDSRSAQRRRVSELDSDLLPSCSSRSQQEPTQQQQQTSSGSELATHEEDDWREHVAALWEALRSHRPRLRVSPQWQARGDQVVEFARRNKNNLFTSSLAVSALFLLLPLCVLYYKAGTVAADMPRQGRFLVDDSFGGGVDGRAPRGFNIAACVDFHPLADSESPRHPDLPFVDTEDFIPYRIKPVSRNAIFCVYQNDVFVRFPKLRYRVVDVPGAYCTHVIYHAAGVTADGSIYSKDPVFDETHQGFRQASELKGVYPHLKILLSLGGGPDERDTFQFSRVARDLNSTRAFADKAYWWLVNKGFDGLHLDWRQPAGACGTRTDKQNFVVLVATLRERFGLRYVITVGVPYQDSWRHRGYHLPGLAQLANFLLATTHGFSDANQLYTQCPSPYGTPSDNITAARAKSKAPGDSPTMYDVIRTLKYEVPRKHRHRLCFSVSLKGHHWTLRSPGAFHVGSPARAPGPPMGDSRARGLIEYPLVCKFLLRDSVDPDGLCSYAVSFRNWVAYEGPKSLTVKLARIREDMGTPGVCLAVWDLAFDDHKGDCGNSRSPLLKTIYNSLSATRVWVYPRGTTW